MLFTERRVPPGRLLKCFSGNGATWPAFHTKALGPEVNISLVFSPEPRGTWHPEHHITALFLGGVERQRLIPKTSNTGTAQRQAPDPQDPGGRPGRSWCPSRGGAAGGESQYLRAGAVGGKKGDNVEKLQDLLSRESPISF